MEKRNYHFQPTYAQERAPNQIWQDQVVAKWEVQKRATNMHGNINMILRFDKRINRFLFLDDWPKSIKERAYHLSFYEVISSAFLLYRLICIGFYPQPFDKDGYKTLWTVGLKHRETGHNVSLSDYKAGSNLASFVSEKTDMPPVFERDLLELLDFLVSNQLVHPYDLTVAGSVA